MPIQRTGEDVSKWYGKKYGRDILDVFGFHSELTRLSYVQQEEVLRLRRIYGKDDPRSVEAFRQYTIIRNQIARARTQGTWADTEFQTYLDAPTEANYKVFITAAEKTQAVSPLAAAPPKRPELEEERGMIFSTLLYLESVSGTTIYNLRKKLGFGKTDWIEQTEADETLKEISPSQALGYTTRETRVWTPRGITGLLTDIVLDPLTYISPVASVGGKALKIGKAGKKTKIGEEGIKILDQQTKWIREAFPDIGAKEAREAAESLVFDIAKRRKLYAARKYQEPSFSMFGQPIFYWGDVGKTVGAVSRWLPYHKKRQAITKDVESEIRKTFEPFYEVGQVAGERGKDIFKQIIRKTDYETDVWSQRAKEMYKKGPKFWRRKETTDVHEQTLEWIQRGVEPTDPRVYDMAEDLITGQREMAEAEIKAGLLDPQTLREGYVFRVYEPKFQKEVLEKEFGHRKGEDIAMYSRMLESKYPRVFMPESTHKEINEWAMREYGMKALVTSPPQILRMRGVESSRAIGMAELRRRIGEELGVPAEQIAPLAARRYKKYTPEEIDNILVERYGEKLIEQYKVIGAAESAKMEGIEDVFKYLERGEPRRFDVFADIDTILKSIDDQIEVAEAARVAGKKPWHVTARGREAENKIAELVEKRQLLEDMRVTTPLTISDDLLLRGTPAEASRYLVPGGDVDVLGKLTPVTIETGLTAMPKTGVVPIDWMRHVSEQKAIQNQIDETDTILTKQRAILSKETILPKTTKAGQKATVDVWALQESRAQISEFYSEFSRMSPAQRSARAAQLSNIAGITKEDKNILNNIQIQAAIGFVTTSPISWARETEQKKIGDMFRKIDRDRDVLAAKTLLDPLPESVMVGEMGAKRKLVAHEYILPSGEKHVAYVDEDVIKELDRKAVASIKIITEAERYMRWMYTVPHVAFHVRNIQGILQQNLYNRVSPKAYAMNWEILHGDPEKIFDVPIYGKMSAAEIKQMYEEAGIYGKLGYIEDPMKFKELPMGPMPEIENLGRGALATELLMAGKGIDETAHIVRQTHFEYGGAGLTAREQKVARHMFLFYTWPKKNVELTARMLGQQPGTIAATMKFQQAWVTPEEYEQLPWWAKESYVLTANGNFYVLDVPALNALQLMTGEGYAFSHTPLMKFYIGAVWGRDPTTGRPLGIEDMPMWAAEAGVGRFISLKREFERVQEGEIPWTRMAKHQVGGVYVGELEDIPLKRAYLESQMVEWRATEEEKIAAFEASGKRASHYETLWKPPPALRGEVMEEPKSWWQKYPWDWGYPWDEEEPEFVGEKGIVIGYSQEEWDIIAGHRLSDEQKEEVKLVLETSGVDSAAGLRTQMAAEYHAARAAFAGREPATQEMITESYNQLVGRVGTEAAKKAHYRTYYSEEDKLLGIMAFTPEEWEDVKEFELSEAQKQWMFRETLTDEEAEYNARTELANQIEGIQSLTAMIFPRPTIAPHMLPEQERIAMAKKWEEEREAQRLQETEWREELAELREDPIGVSISQKGIPAALMLTRGGQAMQTRFNRSEELENLLGTGVDR